MSYGEPFVGEVVSLDASAGVAFTLYLAGSTTPYTLLATDFVSVSDYVITRTTSGTAAIVGATDVAGKRLVKGSLAAQGGIVQHLKTDHVFAEGVTPVLIAAADAGYCAAIIHGAISHA
jgi:hypothetical protein